MFHKYSYFTLAFILYSFILFSCKPNSQPKQQNVISENKTGIQIQSKDSSALARYDFESENNDFIELPSKLREISGMTILSDGRLFCHGDENATIYEIDYKSGEIIKRFHLGKITLQGDFEDIAYLNKRFYLVSSKGYILSFNEGNDEENIDYETFDTFLKGKNNIEGLCYDSETKSLLLACKDDPGENYKGFRAVYSFSLEKLTLDEKPRFLLPVDEISKVSVENEFNPSGIVRHPLFGTFFIIAARGNIIVEVSKSGVIINYKTLSVKYHKQPEGIALDKDNNLYISDEGKQKSAKIFKYKMKN
jgi:uncharacterized protein YjiK